MDVTPSLAGAHLMKLRLIWKPVAGTLLSHRGLLMFHQFVHYLSCRCGRCLVSKSKEDEQGPRRIKCRPIIQLPPPPLGSISGCVPTAMAPSTLCSPPCPAESICPSPLDIALFDFFYKRPEGGAGVDLQRHIGLTSDIRRCDTFILLPLADLFSIWCVRPLGNNIRSLPPPSIFIPLLFTRKRTQISVNIDAAYGPHESNSVRTYSDYAPDRSIFDPPS